MRTMMRATVAAAALLALSACYIEPSKPEAFYGSSVRIEVAGGELGSGVAIGNGVVITAAHVVGDNTAVLVRGQLLDTGLTGLSDEIAEVLWTSKEHDIAAIRISSDALHEHAKLDCRSPRLNEPVYAIGNPMGIEFLSIHGHVANKRSFPLARRDGGAIESVFAVDITTIGGMSGGALFDTDGEVLGIIVATASGNPEFAYGNIGFVVPATVVCELLGRESV